MVDTGQPPQLFKPGIPVVLEGHWQGAVYASDQIMVKHTASYTEAHPDRLKSQLPPGHHAVNAAVGESAVLLALAGALAGCVTLVIGLVRGRDNLLRAGRTYTWVILLGAVVATSPSSTP